MRLFSALNFESPKKPLSNGLSALKSPGGISVKSPAALLKPDAKPNLGPTSPKPLVFKVNKDQNVAEIKFFRYCFPKKFKNLGFENLKISLTLNQI